MDDGDFRPRRLILVIDDQLGEPGSPHQKSFLRNYERLPYVFLFASCSDGHGFAAEKALEVVEAHPEIEMVLLDLKFGDDQEFGYSVLELLTERYRDLPVLVMSSMDRDVSSLGRCLAAGALGFVVKHRSAGYLEHAIEQAVDLMKSHVLLGESPQMRELRRQAARLSPYPDIPVLISGPSGTGKERLARYIWQSGARSRGPFVYVRCRNADERKLDQELFGRTSAAGEALAGAVSAAQNGVLFLDDVEALPPSLEFKLMRCIEQKAAASDEKSPLNVQVISATRESPEALLRSGKVHPDFYDFIAAVKIQTPALRACAEDVPILANYFVQRLSNGRKQFADGALRLLREHSWPGNVRELQKVVQEAVINAEAAGLISVQHLPDYIRNPAPLLTEKRDRQPDANDNEADRETQSVSSLSFARERLLRELRLAAEVKERAKAKKGNQWRAEFMRQLYPHYKAQNAKGVRDVLKRFQAGPWGDPNWEQDSELARLIRSLQG